ncbi:MULTISPECIES: hypothetical protein [unclassified Sphingomonas]|uniref:hypothetical protein n=1 Tax=unclassified Sphingomonas TaxID=196159 RepID=UPI0012E150B5|nr:MULTISPECIES: hypothetical protein [unclassified Sphingomonas]
MYTEANDFLLRSCLHEVENEMGQAVGLEKLSNYAPVMCAFAILDQMGSTYSDSSKQPYPDVNASGIKKALYYWAGYQPNGAETKALYSFRNGIYHDGSLTNRDNSGQWYIFRYKPGMGSPVALASKPWDGTAAGLGPSTQTLIDVRELVALARSVIDSVRGCFLNRRGDFSISKSKEEILHKYIFWAPRK